MHFEQQHKDLQFWHLPEMGHFTWIEKMDQNGLRAEHFLQMKKFALTIVFFGGKILNNEETAHQFYHLMLLEMPFTA